MAFKTDERYKISKCYDHELLHIAPHIFIALSNQKYYERLYQVAEGRSS